MIAEPRLAVFLVRIDDESVIRGERRRRPLPDIADHLPTPRRTVEVVARADVDRVTGGQAEVARDRCAARRDLPLRLARQPATRPPAPRLGLVGIDVDDRPMRLGLD